jgi:hypothetical protein
LRSLVVSVSPVMNIIAGAEAAQSGCKMQLLDEGEGIVSVSGLCDRGDLRADGGRARMGGFPLCGGSALLGQGIGDTCSQGVMS